MGQERRKYYRYPVQGGSEAVVVRHQGVERPAKLVNLSADGFRLDMDEESIVEVGDIVLMATSSGFHRVRVVNVARENGMLQLGLQRLQDVPASAVESQSNGKRARKERPTRKITSPYLQLGVPAVLGALIAGTAIWIWTSDADPVGAVVEDKTFVTPTSEYGGRRRRQAESEEVASTELSKRRGPRVVGDGEPGSRLTPGGKSTDTKDGSYPGADRSNESGGSRGSSQKSTDLTVASASLGSASNDLSAGRDSAPGEAIGSGGSIFDSRADATQSIKAALSTANRENKRVVVEFGGNDCESCNLLHAAFTKDAEIASSFQKAFVLVLVDMEANKKLVSDYVQDEVRAPFLALLNREGKVMKRRRTEDLGSSSKLDFGKVKAFLQQWSSAS